MESNNNKEVIDLRELFLKLWSKRKQYVIVTVVAIIVGCIYIFPVPRFYKTDVSLAPEGMSTDINGGAIGSLASSFGIDLGMGQSTDAFYPLLYPDIIASSNFIVSLFDIHVTTIDGKYSGDYFTYLLKHQKHSPWAYPGIWLSRLKNKIAPPDDMSGAAPKRQGGKQGQAKASTFYLTRPQDNMVEKIRNAIVCNVNRKTYVISFTVKDQDPLVSAAIADSVRTRLQKFITDYRTSKAKQDVVYYERLTSKAKADYERVRQTYAAYSDANQDVVLQSFRSKQEDLENDMQIRFNTYTAFNTQLQAARATLQKRTPAFTVIQGAQVPLKPAGPKRMLTVLAIMLLAIIGYTCYLLRKDMLSLFTPSKA